MIAMASAALSRVCHKCGTHWPNVEGYEKCPECLRHTVFSSVPSIDAAEAHSRLTHARFERWLDEHDRRGQIDALEQIPVQDGAA